MLELLVFILGVSLGSFVNVLVIRLAANEKIDGRSHCRSCGRQLAWYHNIPLLSFLVLQGKCVWCRSAISWQYPIVELSTGLLFLLGVFIMPAYDWLWLASYFVLVSYAVTLFLFDLRFKVLPDVITISGTVILFLLNLLRGVSWPSLLAAILLAAGFFALQYLISRGRWIGSGDIRLGALMGAALGWPGVVVALVVAYWLGAAVGLGLILFKNYGAKSELPFGTMLTFATVATFLWGEAMINLYLTLVGY